MKKILKGLLLSCLIASSVYGAKVATADEFGRLYNTAYFDITPVGDSSILGTIEYSKRIGTFNWSDLSRAVNHMKKDTEFKISTRVEVPSNIKTEEVYITIGSTFYFMGKINEWTQSKLYALDKWTGKAGGQRSHYLFTTKINDKIQSGSEVFLAKTNNDPFGNKFVNLSISLSLLLPESEYQKNVYSSFKRNVLPLLKNIKIKVAPKSRTFQSKWVEPKIYVMDE